MFTRREMVQALVASAGAGAVVPDLAAHPFTHHLADPLTIDQADAKTKTPAGAYTPEFLDQHQFDTLAALAERIVPGSAKAKVSEFVDQLLVVDAPEDQRSFLNALGAMEGKALAHAGRPWKQLSDADQIAVLTEVSTMASGRPPASFTLRDHFDLLKGWIAGAYYSTEMGMRELGWTGTVAHRGFPGCEHPGGHP